MHHNFETVGHRIVQFSAKCSESNSLQDKSQCLNMAIKYSFFYSRQVNYLMTKLTAKSLRQICDINKVRDKATFHCLAGNSAIILLTVQPFSICTALINNS